MSDTADRLQELLDRTVIVECLHRYARGIDRHDVELVASCYHPDAVDDHGLFLGSGRGLAEWANGAHAQVPRHQHHITNTSIELDGDTAHSEAYYLVVMRGADDSVNFGSGRYLDRFERRDGEWRIAARVVVTETMSSLGTADMAALDRAFAPSLQDGRDPSCQRPLEVARKSADEPHPPR